MPAFSAADETGKTVTEKDLIGKNLTVYIDDVPYVVNITDGVAKLTMNNLSAGVHSAKAYYAGDARYVELSKIFRPQIAKAVPTITYPIVKEGLIYDGQAQDLIVAGSTSGGEMQYKLDDGEYSTSVPNAINPGEYVIYEVQAPKGYYLQDDNPLSHLCICIVPNLRRGHQ